MEWATLNRNPKTIANLLIERDFWAKGSLVAGIDEAGRGSLAGPVVAACVVYPIDFEPDFVVMDSKLLTPKRRQELFEQIISNAFFYSYSFVEAKEIDCTNILLATHKAMEMAIRQATEPIPFCLIDGNSFSNNSIQHRTIIDGDRLSFSIASASIVAKVLRDRWMIEVAHSNYPEFRFDQHKGYGTRYHFEMIKKYGLTEIHRRSFLKKFINRSNKLFEG